MIKKIVWILVILFVGWAFMAWLLSGDADLQGMARSAGRLFNDGKEALGIFFEELLG
jgi:hypothetical protein